VRGGLVHWDEFGGFEVCALLRRGGGRGRFVEPGGVPMAGAEGIVGVCW